MNAAGASHKPEALHHHKYSSQNTKEGLPEFHLSTQSQTTPPIDWFGAGIHRVVGVADCALHMLLSPVLLLGIILPFACTDFQ